MRVLFVHNAPFMGGAEKSLIDLVLGLLQRQMTCRIVQLGRCEEFESRLHESGLEVEVLNAPKFGSQDLVGSLNTWRQLAHSIRAFSPSLLHANNITCGKYLAPLKVAFRIPQVTHLRDVVSPRGLDAKLLALSDRLISISHFSHQHLPPRLSAKSKVIYNGFKIERVAPLKRSTERAAQNILSLAAYTPQKSTLSMLQAAEILRQNNFEFCWRFVGQIVDKSYFEQCQEFVFERKLQPWIQLQSFAQDIEALYQQSMLVVNGGLAEAFGRTTIEASLYQRPCLAVASGAYPETIVHGQTGWLCPPNDPQAMANAIISISKNPAKREQIARQARQRSEELFSIEQSATETHRLYRDLL